MGAHIEGIGSSTLHVTGVSALSPVTHATVGDRIVAGTWAFATAIAGGDVSDRPATFLPLVQRDHLTVAKRLKPLAPLLRGELLGVGHHATISSRPHR